MSGGRPWLSGWCNPSAAEWSHRRCVGGYAGATCRCACHTAPPVVDAPEPPQAEQWPVYRMTWTEPTGEDTHSLPSTMDRFWHDAALRAMADRGCTNLRLYEGTATVAEWRPVETG